MENAMRPCVERPPSPPFNFNAKWNPKSLCSGLWPSNTGAQHMKTAPTFVSYFDGQFDDDGHMEIDVYRNNLFIIDDD